MPARRPACRCPRRRSGWGWPRPSSRPWRAAPSPACRTASRPCGRSATYADSLGLPGDAYVLTVLDRWPSVEAAARATATPASSRWSRSPRPRPGGTPPPATTARPFGADSTGVNEALVTGVIGAVGPLSINDTRPVPIFETGQVAAVRQGPPTYLKILVAVVALLVVAAGVGLGLHNQLSAVDPLGPQRDLHPDRHGQEGHRRHHRHHEPVGPQGVHGPPEVHRVDQRPEERWHPPGGGVLVRGGGGHQRQSELGPGHQLGQSGSRLLPGHSRWPEPHLRRQRDHDHRDGEPGRPLPGRLGPPAPHFLQPRPRRPSP